MTYTLTIRPEAEVDISGAYDMPERLTLHCRRDESAATQQFVADATALTGR